jgi:hypothetical protein
MFRSIKKAGRRQTKDADKRRNGTEALNGIPESSGGFCLAPEGSAESR